MKNKTEDINTELLSEKLQDNLYDMLFSDQRTKLYKLINKLRIENINLLNQLKDKDNTIEKLNLRIKKLES